MNVAISITLGVLSIGLGVTLWQMKQVRRDLQRALRVNDRLRASNSTLSNYVDLDDLTVAQSRRYLSDRIDSRPRRQTHCLLFVDLDEFKAVNDNYGHEVGDALLIQIADAMVLACRPGDFVARLGGDEFCVFLQGCKLDYGVKIAERFRQAVMATSVMVGDRTVFRTATFGVGELGVDQTLAEGLSLADAALYKAKANGKNKIIAADAALIADYKSQQERASIEDVAEAMVAGEITYFVQPIFDLNTDQVMGVEALARWIKPDGTVILPSEFMEQLTENYKRGVRPPFQAAKEAVDHFVIQDPPIYFAWNISTSFLNRTNDPEPIDGLSWLEELLQGQPPNQTVFEIVEHTVIENPTRTKALLQRLRAEGIRIALDDFGTGMSNLERLMEYPVDIVKIDRSFVQGLECGTNRGILQGLVQMSKTMGFDIIAEGIETEAHLDQVKQLGITLGQGYFLGHPAPPAEWIEKISAQRSQ